MARLSKFILFLTIIFSACSDLGKAKIHLKKIDIPDSPSENEKDAAIPYILEKPDRKWKMPDDLKEISGIVKMPGDTLLAIEDLHPILYFIDVSKPNAVIAKKLTFEDVAKDKFDIEDVTMDSSHTIYAIWSHGVIFKITDWRNKMHAEPIETGLDKKNNTEGIAYNPATGNLLVACKNESGLEDEKKSTRAVYAYDTSSEKLKQEPFLVIEKKEIDRFMSRKVEFYPSAIGVHPISHDIFVISTKGNKSIACFDQSGKLKGFEFLDPELLPQPEGICFDQKGNIFISTEGRHGEPAYVYEFAFKKQ
jgi:uncharacterized protein YjiK